jgi:TolB-like protein/DNA-binding winged helix-turn-helix (wHTH) protein
LRRTSRTPILAEQEENEVALRFGDCEIDLGRHELRRSDRVVPVEPQVFDLLLHLVRNRSRVVSKDELIDAIWQGRIVSEAALSSRMSAARRAIGDTGEDQRLIRTLHKRGFRFVGRVDEDPAPSGASKDSAISPPTIPSQSADAAEPQGESVRDGAAARAPVLELPDKPWIAVLPFVNMSGNPDQDYFADGLTEDIITGLSQQQWFFVIARNSTFAFKNEAIDVRAVASQLGVRYVLEGSVRRAAGRVRVTGQLIDAAHGVHMWGEKYDRELADIFELQDDITQRVIGSVGPEILAAEAARIRRKPPNSMDAWDLVMRALPHMWRVSADEQRRAQQLLQQAIALDAEYAHAHALLGWTYISMFNLDSRTPIGEFTERALEAGARAVDLNEEEPWGHLVLGLGHARRRRPDAAITHLSISLDLNPSFALAHAGMGYAMACGGQPECGLKAVERARRLSPRDPFLAIYAPTVRYMALFALGRYEEAVTVCRATAALHPNHAGAWRLMTVSLGLLGRIDEAREALAHTLTLQPDLTSAHVTNNTVFADPSVRSQFLLGLRRAGLKD